MEFREFAFIFVPRYRIPSISLLCRKVWNRSPRVFCSAEQPEFRRNKSIVLCIPSSAEFFLSEIANPSAGPHGPSPLFREGTLHRKKKVHEFPVPSRDVTTKLSLGGNNDVIAELFLPRGSLVRDIPAGDEKLMNLFYGVGLFHVLKFSTLSI
jgi:hypothetical protein